MIKGILFDMDGTLIDSEEMHTMSLIDAIKEKMGIEIQKSEIEKYVGLRYIEKLKRIFQDDREDLLEIANLGAEKNGRYLNLVKEIPGVRGMLRKLKKNFKLGLVTASNKNQAEVLLDLVGIKKYFDVILTSEDVKRNKPNPEPYLLASKKLGLNPEECVVVEDSETGLESGKRAGMKCILIKHKYNGGQDFSRADIILEDRNKITPELIKSLG